MDSREGNEALGSSSEHWGEPRIQMETTGTGETWRETHLIAQAEYELCQEFCPSSMKHGLHQPRGFRRSRDVMPRRKGYAGAGRPLRRNRGSAGTSYDLGVSDLYSSADSTFIYAGSIHAYATSCSGVSHDFDSHHLVRRRCDLTEEPVSTETSKDWPGCSVEAAFGSDSPCDGESDRSFDSCDVSLAEAQWGSASSRAASGSTTDYGSGSSYGGCSEEASRDLYNGLTPSSDSDQNEPERAQKKSCGVVIQTDRREFSPFFYEMMKDAALREEMNTNEGFLFHPQKLLQTKNSEYREGREYSFLQHIQNGSYGDVFSVRDKQTGFTCAAKRIPLSSFSWEEVGTWSRLDSPHVLQLFGAVREGLNVVLFMDLKTGSVAQLLKEGGALSEHLALYYHCQVLRALEHLHSRRVIHLDVKVDNVLLSEDMRHCFLCDFGLSEMLDQTGFSTKTFRGNGLRGTESHMSPEVARGDPRSGKADIWSSCCMLLHMLSGYQPWTRFFTHPLCLKIVSEPAPLWEIPPGCDVLTCDLIRGGLVKEPTDRDSAREQLEKSLRALREVGGSRYPASSSLQIPPPLRSEDAPTSSSFRMEWVSGWRERAAREDGTDSEASDSDEENEARENVTSAKRRLLEHGEALDSEMQSDDEEEWSDLGSLRNLVSDWVEEELEPFHRLQTLCGPNRQRWPYDQSDDDEEWSDTTSARSTNVGSPDHLTCHRSVCTSEPDSTDKESVCSEDWSSGVFSSCSSLSDEQSFNVDWSVSTNQPPSCCFEGLGVDIWVEDVSRDTFRIRERLKVKLGHVAIGISAQISMRAFTLATVDGKPVSPDTEVLESGVWLLCIPAPDGAFSWSWRIRDGKMEMQEPDGPQSDTCSTLEA